MITYLSRSLEWLDFTDTGLLKSLFLAPPTTPKRGKRLLCRLGATAPKRHNSLFLLGRGLPLLSATFEKPCLQTVAFIYQRWRGPPDPRPLISAQLFA